MQSYLDDFKFVFDAINQFNRVKGVKRPFTEWLATLPHPSGKGSMLCGMDAYQRLRDMTERALAQSRIYAGKLEAGAVFSELQEITVQRFFREKRELNTKEADRAVSAAVKAAAKHRQTLTHFIPCHLVTGRNPDVFSMGPVLFHQRSSVLKNLQPALQRYIKDNDSDTQLRFAEALANDICRYYEAFDWVAEVTIEDCDGPTSRKRAKRFVQGALDCLHLLIGGADSYHMRAGGPTFGVDRRGHIEVDPKGCANLGASAYWLSHDLGDDWWDRLNEDGGDHVIGLMGIAIKAAHALPKPAPMAQRFLEGAAWYGEAVRDEFAASKVIKYVTAIERILTTKNEKNICETLSNRGAALIHEPGTDDLEVLRRRFKKVYVLRSDLVHGSRSPLDRGFGPGMREAEEVSRTVLLNALQLFRREGLEAPVITKPQLEDFFVRLLQWSENTRSKVVDASSDLGNS